jgi:hypothetical protein
VSITVLATGFATDFYSSAQQSDVSTTSSSASGSDNDVESETDSRGAGSRSSKPAGRTTGVTNLSERNVRNAPPNPNSWRQDAVNARERLPGRNMGKVPSSAGRSSAGSAGSASKTSDSLFGATERGAVGASENRFTSVNRAQFQPKVKKVGIIGRVGGWFKRLFT